jgi:transposase
MSKMSLQDQHWIKIRDFLKNEPHAYIGKNEANCRRFVEAVLWISRSGAQWRLLPTEYGQWNTIYKRFARWCDRGVWERLLQHFADDPDMENGMIDSTIVRAHPCAAGAQKKVAVKQPKPWGVVEVALPPKCMSPWMVWEIL